MYLERQRTKGITYLYLKTYFKREHYSSNKMTIYKFGRVETALRDMYEWKRDFKTFPNELLDNGCTKEDLNAWITTLETGIHKTGRKFCLVV